MAQTSALGTPLKASRRRGRSWMFDGEPQPYRHGESQSPLPSSRGQPATGRLPSRCERLAQGVCLNVEVIALASESVLR